MNKSDDATQTAGVVLTRERDGQLEVLWAERPASAGFLGGFHSFVVGRLEEADADAPLDVAEERLPTARGFAACALRELFEEVGVLVLDGRVVAPAGSHIASQEAHRKAPRHAPLGDWGAYRRELLEDAAHLGADLRAASLRLGASRLVHLGSWRTPSWIEGDFHTEFFWLHASAEESEALGLDTLVDHADPDEIAAAAWIRPADALSRWREGRARLTTPIQTILELSAEHGPSSERLSGALDRQRDSHLADAPMELVGGLRLLALKTATLPPATHTNAFLVGEERFVVVDPGSAEEAQIALLESAIAGLQKVGGTFEAVVLTHHHRDHISGAPSLLERHDVPVWAHPEAASQVDFAIDRELEDGEVLELGSHRLICLHTPGHAPDHLCLHHPQTDTLLAGDLVASKGTIVINPPEGHVGDYLESLERMLDLRARTMLPAHGWAVVEPARHLQHYLEHRRARERSIFEALERAGSPVRPLDLVPEVYDDVPAHIWPLAARSLLAHLIHLVEQGHARREGDDHFSAC